MTYRTSQTPRYECGRGHLYVGQFSDPTAWYCTIGQCASASGLFTGPEAEMRRLRVVFDGVPKPSAR